MTAAASLEPVLTLLYREGCHLCEDMEQQLAELLPAGAFSLHRVDIDEHPELRAQHNARVPVLLLAGNELCHHFLDLQAVREGLASYTCKDVTVE